MKNDERNAAVARALGWQRHPERENPAADPPPPTWTKPGGKTYVYLPNFSTSLDTIRRIVLPELERRGLQDEFAEALCISVDADFLTDYGHALNGPRYQESGTTYSGAFACLSADPAILCEAFLAVMAPTPKAK